MDKEVKSIECRFVVYCKPTSNGDDLHVVKEQIHTVDGEVVPNVRLIKNFKRKFWITKKAQRTHLQKKEYTKLENVIEYQSTQGNLIYSIANVLGGPPAHNSLRKLCRNPYIYGADILSTAVVKKAYQTKYPDINTFYNVAIFDTETDMVNDTEEIVMATLSFKSKVITVIKESFVAGHSDVINRLNILLKKYLGEHVEKRKINWEVLIVPTEVNIVTEIFKKAHEWKPDIIAIWNMDFDIPKVINALEKAGIDPKNVFSDPIVPKEYRHFSYHNGSAVKVTASGKEMSKNYYEQWHTVYAPSSFYFIDAMCLYYQIRTQGGKEQSYSLNAILDKHLGIRKLNFDEAEKYVKAEWHQFMQSKYPLEYVIYNVFDCISMELLDESTNDISLTLPMFSGCSDFHHFNSQPKRLADDMHYFCLDNGYVYGTTSDEMVTKDDSLVTSGVGWIVTLEANLVSDSGLRVIEEDPNMRSNIRAMVGDLDATAAYPSGECVFNVSRETTHKELIRIEGVPESIRRQQGLNLSGGLTNAVEIANDLYKLPTMHDLLSCYNEHQKDLYQ